MAQALEYIQPIKFKKKTLHVVAISFYLTFQQFSSLNHLLKTREESKTKAIERISSWWSLYILAWMWIITSTENVDFVIQQWKSTVGSYEVLSCCFFALCCLWRYVVFGNKKMEFQLSIIFGSLCLQRKHWPFRLSLFQCEIHQSRGRSTHFHKDDITI